MSTLYLSAGFSNNFSSIWWKLSCSEDMAELDKLRISETLFFLRFLSLWQFLALWLTQRIVNSNLISLQSPAAIFWAAFFYYLAFCAQEIAAKQTRRLIWCTIKHLMHSNQILMTLELFSVLFITTFCFLHSHNVCHIRSSIPFVIVYSSLFQIDFWCQAHFHYSPYHLWSKNDLDPHHFCPQIEPVIHPLNTYGEQDTIPTFRGHIV